jgi:hypothetical protein
MTTRRAMLLGALVALSAAFAPAAGKTDVLEVTYYYLPG